MGLRQLKRQIAKNVMHKVGISQPNKKQYDYIDDSGKFTTKVRDSFFSTHWKDMYKTNNKKEDK